MSSQQDGRLGVGIIGMGHVGPVLGSALRAAGHTIVGVNAHSESSRDRADAFLPNVPVLDVPTLVERCELVILAIPDDALAPLVSGLAQMRAWQPGQLVVHTSGVYGTSVLQPAHSCGAIPLAIHPAMIFSGWSADVSRLVGTPFAVTAPAPVLPIAEALVVEMGGEPIVIDEGDRSLYNAAISHGSDHLAVLVTQTMRVLRAAGIDEPGMFLRRLTEDALDRALSDGETSLSGAPARGDAATVENNMRALLDAAQGSAGGADLGDVANTYGHLSEAEIAALERNRVIDEATGVTLRAALVLSGTHPRGEDSSR